MLQNFIELLTIPFGAGESRLLHVSGQYFELIDATNPVDVLLIDKTGAQRGIMRGAEASFHLKNTDFSTIQITSATAQTIRIGYGSGEAGTRRAAGAVSIVGTVPVSGPLTDAQLRATAVPVSGPLTDAQLRASPVVVRAVEAAAQQWNNGGVMGANSPLTVFTAAANVNGAILWSAGASDGVAGVFVQTFVAKATAPATAGDGEIIAQSLPTAGVSTTLYQSIDLQQPRRIAAGLGLYFISSVAGSAGFFRHARFTLL